MIDILGKALAGLIGGTFLWLIGNVLVLFQWTVDTLLNHGTISAADLVVAVVLTSLLAGTGATCGVVSYSKRRW